jgi:hypothetical protein
LAASLFACGILAACSISTSLDGLANGDGTTRTSHGPSSGFDDAGHALSDATSPDDPTPDAEAAQDTSASTEIDSASAQDAAQATDASPAPDAGGQESGVDAGPSSYCASLSPHPLFCNDFDEGQSATSGWDHVASLNGAASIDVAKSLSAPAAFKESVNALSTGATVDVGAYKTFPAFAAKAVTLTYGFDLYVEKIDQTHTAPAVAAALVYNDAAGATWQLQLAITYTGSSISVRTPEWWAAAGGTPSGYTEHLVSATLSLQKWTRVSMQLTLPNGSGGAATVQLTIGGVAMPATSLNVTTSKGTPEMLLGLSYVQSPSDAWIVHYDNVTFDAN